MTANLLEAARWFVVMTAELVVLFLALSFLIGLLQAWVPEEKVRLVFEKRSLGGAYVGGAVLGALTPFCSCSTIPVLAGLLRSGAPFGPTMTFLFASPLLDPVVLGLLAFVSHLSDGLPAIPDQDLGNGIISVPGAFTVLTLPDTFVRGQIRSWNVAMQRELRWGFVGEAAYVGTRQIDQLGFRELNWSPIGGGQAGRQLNAKFGRTGQTMFRSSFPVASRS